MKKNYQFLNDINFPSDLRKVSENNLSLIHISEPTRQAEKIKLELYDRAMVYQDLLKGLKASMIHLEQHIVQHLFRLH